MRYASGVIFQKSRSQDRSECSVRDEPARRPLRAPPQKQSVSAGRPFERPAPYKLPGVAGNEPRSLLIGYVRPRPLKQHEEAIVECDEIEDVHHNPHQPSKETTELEASDLRHRR